MFKLKYFINLFILTAFLSLPAYSVEEQSSENISEIIIPNYASFKLVFWDEFFMKNSNFVINNSF